MIYTSYFGKLKKLPKNVIPVSIAFTTPKWFTGRTYKELAPKFDLLRGYKDSVVDENEYRIRYNQQLSAMDPFDVCFDLSRIFIANNLTIIIEPNCPIWANPNVSVVLLCYEKPEDFCHRHLVAEWFNRNGIKCEEIIL